MTIRDAVDAEYYYLRCKAAFQRCVSLQSNGYLEAELGSPPDALTLREDCVNLSFKAYMSGDFLIEVKVKLLREKDEVGYYLYQESRSGEPLDDYVVLF